MASSSIVNIFKSLLFFTPSVNVEKRKIVKTFGTTFEFPVKHKKKIEENFQNEMGLKNETGYLTF